MKPSPIYAQAWLDFDAPDHAGARLWKAGPVESVHARPDGTVSMTLTFAGCAPGEVYANRATETRRHALLVRALGANIVRLTLLDQPEDAPPDDGASPMLHIAPERAAAAARLRVVEDAATWELCDQDGRARLRVPRLVRPTNPWSTLIQAPVEPVFRAEVLPDGATSVPFQSEDCFAPRQINSVPLGYVERVDGARSVVWALQAGPREKFAGTGERFARADLAGGTYVLENADALGVNNRRAYKNIPFYLSSSGYGCFIHTSAHVRLSLADLSTRAALGRADEAALDLFFIGGPVERVVFGYRQLTGFPPAVPLWTYGMWMSRMTYFSAAECEDVAARLRAEQLPCDVLHLDTGWFRTDWKCEWEFSEKRFPDPAGFMRRLRAQGFRTTLWQTPWVARGTKHFAEAEARRYIVPQRAAAKAGSDFGSPAGDETQDNRAIDFSNPEAVAWYQDLLAALLRLGASAIKTDFGEFMDSRGDYHGLPYDLLHNRYPLLYQAAAWAATARVTGEPVLWARSAWAGCQRYPIHWAGDSASTWDGLAGSIRGGLHLGLSGFGYWSHDVPGFHGLPDFMNHRPSETLYLRWTQAAVFGSHLRYHGTSAREPWEYPGVCDIVRGWLRLRYALIPYLLAAAAETMQTGYPVLRALVFHHPEDPACWHIDDEFYCGGDLLVAPVMNDAGVRDVYLPAGQWIDLWTGETVSGPVLRRAVAMPAARIPVYVRQGACLPFYPERVAHTGEMDLARTCKLAINAGWRGLAASPLGPITGLQ